MLPRWYNTFVQHAKEEGDIILQKQFPRDACVSLSRKGRKKIYINIDRFLLKAFPHYKWSVASLELFVFSFAILIDVSNTGKKKKNQLWESKNIEQMWITCCVVIATMWPPEAGERNATGLGRCGRFGLLIVAPTNWWQAWKRCQLTLPGEERGGFMAACPWLIVSVVVGDFLVWTRMQLKNKLWRTRACRLVNHILLPASM